MTGEERERKSIIAIRIRGTIRASRRVRETLDMLNLTRNNYAVLIDNRPSFLGMMKRARDYITWGEASKEMATRMMKKWGRREGNKKLTDEFAEENGYKSLDELLEAVYGCEIQYWRIPNVRPNFRLHPPTKGFRGKVKKSYGAGGELGYRGDGINELVKRMT